MDLEAELNELKAALAEDKAALAENRRRTRRLTLTNIVLAVVVLAFGGVTAAYAVTLAPANSVNTAAIINRTIGTPDVKVGAFAGQTILDNSMTGLDINEGTLALPGAIKTTAIRINGTKAFGAGTTSKVDTGQYRVDYGSSVRSCTAQATIGSNFNSTGESVAFGTKLPLAFPGHPDANAMTIFVENGVNGYTDAPVFVTLACAAGSAGHTTAVRTSSKGASQPISPVGP